MRPHGTSGGWHFVAGSFSQQHPQKTAWGLIDADARETSGTFLAIADGVTGVQAHGIDPSVLPRELLQRCMSLAHERSLNPTLFDAEWQQQAQAICPNEGWQGTGNWLRNLLSRAYVESASLGATTICLAALEHSELVCCNLGDCQALVLRKPHSQGPYRVHFRTPVQRLGAIRVGGAEVPQQLHRCRQDQPAAALLAQTANAEVFRVGLLDGDVVLMSTDGVVDNLSEEEVVGIMNNFLVSVTAWHSPLLGAVAKQVVLSALNQDRKPDDTTSLAAVVVGPETHSHHQNQPTQVGFRPAGLAPPAGFRSPLSQRSVGTQGTATEKDERDACHVTQCALQ